MKQTASNTKEIVSASEFFLINAVREFLSTPEGTTPLVRIQHEFILTQTLRPHARENHQNVDSHGQFQLQRMTIQITIVPAHSGALLSVANATSDRFSKR